MPIALILMLKSFFVFGPAFALVYRSFRDCKIEVIWLLSLFFALFAAHVSFWTGVFLKLPGTNICIFPLYWLFLTIIIVYISRDYKWIPDAIESNFRLRIWALIEITTILFIFSIYYAYMSRGVPSSGGIYFIYLDLLKFTEETGILYPSAPENLTFTNYALTINAIHYGLLVLLGCGLGFNGHVVSYGLLHGIYVCAFFLFIAAASREIWGSRYWAYLIFLMFFIGIHGRTMSNYYLNVPGNEIATYFLIGCTIYFLLQMIIKRPQTFDFTLYCISASMTASARPYTIPFVTSFSVVAVIFFLKNKSWNGLYDFLRTRFILILLFIPLVFYLNIRNLFAYGNPFPIGRVHSHYSSSFVPIDFFKNLIETVRLFLHYYFPYIEAAVFRVKTKVAYHNNEISLLVSLLASFGLFAGIKYIKNMIWGKRKEQMLTIALGIIATFVLTAFVLVPKNRMFYWFTPIVTLLAIAGIREIMKLNWKVFLPWLFSITVIIFLTPSPFSFVELMAKKHIIKFPQKSHLVSFKGSIEYMKNIRKAITNNPGCEVMITGIEPGLDDFVLTPNRYYWNAISFPQEVERIFENKGWNHKECIDYLRENKIKIISINVPIKSKIHFLLNKENSSRFWNLILQNPEVFKKIDSLKGDYRYRSIYQVS